MKCVSEYLTRNDNKSIIITSQLPKLIIVDTETKVNEHLLRISSGYITISEPLKNGSTVYLNVKATVTQITEKDNQDNTVDIVHTVKGEIAHVITDKGKDIFND